ncbi:putative late blight resistance protein homolog R1A-3 [Salvia miltiorrhiza]|uniref:putative late blight resistance protein homolog R1A-3 n=1 Tax=Salvia miltiorrhiza TaxID=226208 RepID=UPI0025AC522F|nr:putative late blight resistance protein homolog R1A-3 [Salvia miltiorrhiza]
MAAYSAVAAFRQTLKQLLDSHQFPTHVSESQIEFLHENVKSLQESLDKIAFVPKLKRPSLKELQNKIREAIYAAQDEVEYWSRGHSPEKSGGKTMEELADAIKDVEKEAVVLEQEIRDDPKAQNLFSNNGDEPAFNFSGKDKIVGQEEDFKTVTGWLQADDKARLVIPITGLPGIGKTTLARSIYDDKQTRIQFNIRAWVTVSQDVNYQEVFTKILNTMESKNFQAGHYATQGDEHTLLTKLHQELYNLKYLIVVDDVWDTKAWDRIALALPDKENGSRILLTTRIGDVADALKNSSFLHKMKPLGLEHSWELLCYRVFGDRLEDPKDDITKFCPSHLKDTGRIIAEKCKGLPLSLVVVGGLLIQERQQIDYWKRIEEDVADAATKGEDSYLEILALSYVYLPGKLKGCFLYMGAFPEDCEIRVTKLIKLWVAEGFLPAPKAPSAAPAPAPAVPNVEQVAQKSLEDLIGRNLLSIRKKSSNGGMKACGMHDSLRELAEKECGMEKFFFSRKKYNQEVEEESKLKRRVSVHRNILMCLEEVYNKTRTITPARSLLYLGSHHHHPMPFFLTFDLLKVLDAFTCYFIQFPDEFLDLVHLTYLSFTYNGKLPTKVTHLKKLETLMVRREPKIIFVGASFLPDEIWEMPLLRHLWFTETDFPALPPAPRNITLLFNLQTLASVDAAYFTNEVLDNMPNLRKLAMWIESPGKINFTVSKLTKLEHFRFVVLNPIPDKGIEVESAESFFPRTLTRVTLSGTGLPWEYMKFVAKELKGIEVLKLKELAFNGPEWCPDCQMKELKYLLIEYLNFQKWEATNSHFPKLQRLIMRHCYELEKLPDDIVYIGPLVAMEMVDCSPQAVSSAEDIIDKAESFNEGFEGRIFSSWE